MCPADPTPPFVPIITCKTGVNTFYTSVPCGGGNTRRASYTCHDGTTGTLGETSSCKSSAEWKRLADLACEGKSNCPGPTRPQPISGCTNIACGPIECPSGLVCQYDPKQGGDFCCKGPTEPDAIQSGQGGNYPGSTVNNSVYMDR